MRENYKIVAATQRDVTGIAKVHVDTWRTAYKGVVPQSYLDELSYEERETMWRSVIKENALNEHLWVAKDGSGKVIGFSSGGKNRDTTLSYDGEVFAIYLLAEFHGQGIGKQLFISCLEQLFRHGFTKAVLWVLEDNPTRKFYEAMGGEAVGEKWEEIGGKRLKEIAYGWPDILGTLRKLRPAGAHPNIKNYSEIQEDDRHNHYPNSEELLSVGSPFAKMLGLKRLGIHHELLKPGRRTSWPHAEEDEEEFIYVIEGNPEVWIDGEIYALKPGDGVAFPCGTGVCHTFINNTNSNVRLLGIGEATKPANKIYYPLHPARKEEVGNNWWSDIPQRKIGRHDGLPDALRRKRSPNLLK